MLEQAGNVYSALMDTLNCILCSSASEIFGAVYDDRYGYHGSFDLVRCPVCGHKTVKVALSQDHWIRLYTDYYPRSTFDIHTSSPVRKPGGLVGWFNGVTRSAYAWVPRNVRVLDIGCGFGEALAYHKDRGCDVYGVEADENIRRVADEFGFNVQVGLFDPEHYEADFFDYVTLDQVVEHVIDPLETLRGVARVLKPGGRAILSTPNSNGWGARLFGRRWINWHAPYHVQHFSRVSMGIAAEKAGLRIDCARTLTSSEWLHYQWIHMLIFPPMGEPSPFWSPKARPGGRDRLIMAFFRLAHRTGINHILTRLFDALGVGDNYLFFLSKP